MEPLHARDDGFSLVEILVALFIMALASAVIVMAIPAPRDPLESEAGRFEAVLERTLDQAVSRGQTRGIRIEEASYQVYVRIGGRWVPARGESENLPGGMTLALLADPSESDDIRPQIIADAAGLVSGPPVRISKGGRFFDILVVPRKVSDD